MHHLVLAPVPCSEEASWLMLENAQEWRAIVEFVFNEISVSVQQKLTFDLW